MFVDTWLTEDGFLLRACLLIEADTRMREVSSVDLVSVSHSLTFAVWLLIGSRPLWGTVKGGDPWMGSYSTHYFRMTSRVSGKKRCWTRRHGKSIEQMNVREFRERLRVQYGIPICLLSVDLVSTKQELDDALVFGKEQFNVRLHFSLPSLLKQLSPLYEDSFAFLHPNVLVTKLLNSTKGAAKGYYVVWGPWAGPYEHLDHPFEPHCSLGISRKRRRGRLVDERNHATLLTKQNLLKAVWDSKLYTISFLPRFALKVLVPNKHYVVKDLSFYEKFR
ncbi:hypothetical protein AAG906_038841 [Vitis piasezkii]